MGSSTSPQRGQALAEITIFITLLILVIFGGSRIALNWNKLFKHQYIDKNLPSANEPALSQSGAFDQNLVFFVKKESKSKITELKENGWKVKRFTTSKYQTSYLLQKDDRALFMTDKIGVLTCLKNCN